MIQLNLLPDVKLEYIKAQRTKRLMFTVSAVSTIVALALLISLLAIGSLQKKHLNDLSADIDAKSKELKNKPQIERILTVQNQLNTLTKLHDAKPAASRVFNYLNDVTPAQVNIGDFEIDFTTQTAIVTGKTESLSRVNEYIDTLKFTTYIVEADGEASDPVKAFSNVVLSNYSLETDNKDGLPAKYSITFNYDPVIFDITQNVRLTIPKKSTTRSSLDNPSDLFQALPQSNTINSGGR